MIAASQFIVFGDYGGSWERADGSHRPAPEKRRNVRILILLRVSSAEQDVVSLLQITLSTHTVRTSHVHVYLFRTCILYIYFLIYHQQLPRLHRL